MTNLCNPRLAKDTSHRECSERIKKSEFSALLVVKPRLHPLDTLKHYV